MLIVWDNIRPYRPVVKEAFSKRRFENQVNGGNLIKYAIDSS